jgi:deoxyribodipyrimidine photo-lyase
MAVAEPPAACTRRCMRRVVPAGWHCAMTPPMRRALVWLKRDLRRADHGPLAAAAAADQPALALFVIEPARPGRARPAAAAARGRAAPGAAGSAGARWPSPTSSATRRPAPAGAGPATVRWPPGAVPQGVAWRNGRRPACAPPALRERMGVALAAHAWTRRGCRPRGWLGATTGLGDPAARCRPCAAGHTEPVQALPPAGKRAAWATLRSFLHGARRRLPACTVQPAHRREGCSRLSEHLAFGTISMRSVHQATEARICRQQPTERRIGLRPARLRRPAALALPLHAEAGGRAGHRVPQLRTVRLLRPATRRGSLRTVDRARSAAWCEGRTGFPMVDACMRSAATPPAG